MLVRTMFKSKIHRATVTGANVQYIGSITIDADLLAAADLVEYEKVQVVDVSNPSAPVIRGSVDLPEEVYGWYGSWDWGSGDQVVQVNDHTLAFFRYRYNYWWDERYNNGAE